MPGVDAVDQGYSPRTGEPVGEPVPHTAPDALDQLARAAAAAVPALAALPDRAALEARADRLRAIAVALEDARSELVAVADAETALGPARLNSELTRARVQFEMFAAEVEEGAFLDVVVDRPDPDAVPAPRPDLRRMLVPVGPVAVYAASNFPFAFSVAGGDTASALAAGTAVLVKAHPGHPQTSVVSGRVIGDALQGLDAPVGTFAVVYGFEAGRDLVRHPAVAAAGFTGSLPGGRALFDLAQARPDPIPFYGELGSVNPAVVTPAALATRGPQIVAGFVASYLQGAGQFCTKPGLLFLPTGHALEPALAEAVGAAAVGPLLNDRIRAGYQHGVLAVVAEPDVRGVVQPSTADSAGYAVAPSLFAVSAEVFARRRGPLLEEHFGPTALIVEYASSDELLAALDAVPGSLTATVHAEPDAEAALVRALLDAAAARAGRVVFDGWPTGVAVTAAMHHGGPWPATTAAMHTSVGTAAIRRFLRPVAYQSVPDALLPAALQSANPLDVPRRIDPPQL
jgi:NADP-dependent aldehyde dehydrogenase